MYLVASGTHAAHPRHTDAGPLAKCTSCTTVASVACPRHSPGTYAIAFAKHKA